jgi:hypothetical protein
LKELDGVWIGVNIEPTPPFHPKIGRVGMRERMVCTNVQVNAIFFAFRKKLSYQNIFGPLTKMPFDTAGKHGIGNSADSNHH